MRTIIVGNVHGCLREFEQLVEKVDYDKSKDRLISLGDLMDRGPESVYCVRYAQQIGAELVASNHDDKHVRYRDWLQRRYDARMTGKPFNQQPPALKKERLEQNELLSDDDVAYLRSAPNFIKLEEHNIICVHAGFLPTHFVDVKDQARADVIRVRWVDKEGNIAKPAKTKDKDGCTIESNAMEQPPESVWWMDVWDGDYDVVYGHNVHSLEAPRVDVHHGLSYRACVGIDTGCCFGGKLTALVLDGYERSFVQVQSGGKYAQWFRGGGEPE